MQRTDTVRRPTPCPRLTRPKPTTGGTWLRRAIYSSASQEREFVHRFLRKRNVVRQARAEICGQGLQRGCFAIGKTDGKVAWSHSEGAVLNPTISIRDKKVFFVESRNPEILKQATGRIHGPNLWKDQFLVALDAYTGKKLWEQPIDTADGTVVFYMLATEHGLVIQSSTEGKYHLYSHDLKTGKQQWETVIKWPDDHHSGHIQHPVAVNGRLFLEPSAFDLKTGEKVVDRIGRRSGCHTYVGTRDALIYRGRADGLRCGDRKRKR